MHERPETVATAVKLLFASFKISLVLNILDSLVSLSAVSSWLALILMFWLYWALITLISRGHAKALMVFISFYVLGFVLAFYVPEQGGITISNVWFFQIFYLMALIMDLIAFYLFAQKPSRDWFRQA